MDVANNGINYLFLSAALEFYTAHGFSYVEVPWMVGREVIHATLPPGATPFSVSNGQFLVGSAEQSFIDLMMRGEKLGRHCAITPCFRDDAIDAWHQKYFMKLELFQQLPVSADGIGVLQEMIGLALSFYGRYLPVTLEVKPQETDIVSAVGGVELGSYGIRSLKDGRRWVYGTGVAEPRLSCVLKHTAGLKRSAA